MLLLEQTSHTGNVNSSKLPYGMRILAYARTIRWVGWGFGEALIPVFIISFSHTFAQMGLFSSMVEITALISLPLIGVWADNAPAKRLVLLSLILYPLVGLSYFLAGVFGAAVFVVLARMVNGFTWELENVGVETYYRRTIHHSKIATSFGFLDTWSNAGWICAALVGMCLVSFVPIHYLLLGISPFALIAYLVALRLPNDSKSYKRERINVSFIKSYGKALAEWRTWNTHLRLLSALVLFSSIVSALATFFLPIDAYLSGANLPMVVLVTIFGSVPSLFGYQLGRLADVRDKSELIALGLFAVAMVTCGIVIFPQYWFKLVAVFIMGIILELFDVVKSSLVTTLGPAETYGIRGSVFESMVTFGDLAAPLIIGISLDVLGFSGFLPVIAGTAICFGIIYYFRQTAKMTKRVRAINNGPIRSPIPDEPDSR